MQQVRNIRAGNPSLGDEFFQLLLFCGCELEGIDRLAVVGHRVAAVTPGDGRAPFGVGDDVIVRVALQSGRFRRGGPRGADGGSRGGLRLDGCVDVVAKKSGLSMERFHFG